MATGTDTPLADYEQPEDVEDYVALRKFFAPDTTLAAIDDVAKWLVGLAGGLGVISTGLGLSSASAVTGGDHAAIILLAVSFVLAVAARAPMPVYVNRRSVDVMRVAADKLLWIRGTAVLFSAVCFVTALIVAAVS